MKTVAVIGGGPAGCAAAIQLARGGARVILVVPDGAPRQATVESLPPQAARLLRDLGVWESFLAEEPVPSPGNLSLWGDAVPSGTDFIFNPYGNGWHIDRRHFDAMLLNEARRAGADILCGRASLVKRDDDAWQVFVQSALGIVAELGADVLVWAGGRNVPLPAAFAATRRKLDSLVAIAAHCRNDVAANDFRTWTEAAYGGWWYGSPAIGGRHYIAYFTDADLIPACDRVVWWRDLLDATHLISRRAPSFGPLPVLHGFSASAALAEPAAGDAWMAIGDAALALDPLSSTGTSFALASGKCAADEVLSQQPAGTYTNWVLRHYSRYLREAATAYQIQPRWSESAFWQRRQFAANSVQDTSASDPAHFANSVESALVGVTA